MKRWFILWLLIVLFAVSSCVGTMTVVCLPGGGCVAQVAFSSVPTLTHLPQTTPEQTPTQQLDPTPTITPTWSSCEIGNYYVVVQVDSLAIRQLATSVETDPLNQKVLRRVNAGTVLEVEACLLETTPGGWLPVMTDDGLQGIVHSGYVK
jgi:hypothetical protein